LRHRDEETEFGLLGVSGSSEFARPSGDIRKGAKHDSIKRYQRAIGASSEFDEQRLVGGYTGRDGAEQGSLAERGGRDRLDSEPPSEPETNRAFLDR
jgi:hypothetical protein